MLPPPRLSDSLRIAQPAHESLLCACPAKAVRSLSIGARAMPQQPATPSVHHCTPITRYPPQSIDSVYFCCPSNFLGRANLYYPPMFLSLSYKSVASANQSFRARVQHTTPTAPESKRRRPPPVTASACAPRHRRNRLPLPLFPQLPPPPPAPPLACLCA